MYLHLFKSRFVCAVWARKCPKKLQKTFCYDQFSKILDVNFTLFSLVNLRELVSFQKLLNRLTSNYSIHSINTEDEQCIILNVIGIFRESRLITYDQRKKKTKKKLHNMVQDCFVLYLEILNNNYISIKGGKQSINYL